MSAAHTPGPWSMHGKFSTKLIYARGDNISGVVATINTAWLSVSQQQEQCANACLIAAAPDLLKMVGRLMCIVEAGIPDLEDVDCYQMAKELLAKIDGGAA